jgi:hypothetical protein
MNAATQHIIYPVTPALQYSPRRHDILPLAQTSQALAAKRSSLIHPISPLDPRALQCEDTKIDGAPSSGTAKWRFIRAISSTGLPPNRRLNSRLNCEGL